MRTNSIAGQILIWPKIVEYTVTDKTIKSFQELDIPHNVDKLVYRDGALCDFYGIPRSVKEVIVSGQCNLSSFQGLDPTSDTRCFKRMDISGCKFSSLEGAPRVRDFRISRNPITSLRFLREGLISLGASHTHITSLDYCPLSTKRVVVSFCFLTTLEKKTPVYSAKEDGTVPSDEPLDLLYATNNCLTSLQGCPRVRVLVCEFKCYSSEARITKYNRLKAD
jgi:hypothetical protein